MNEIYDIVNKNFDFSPYNIIKELDLRRPIYKGTACYGHFGKEGFTWEKIKKI
jgi:S-adenosylmethionine synthetase